MGGMTPVAPLDTLLVIYILIKVSVTELKSPKKKSKYYKCFLKLHLKRLSLINLLVETSK